MGRRKRRTIYVNDQRWKVQRNARLRKDDGVCDYSTKTIRLRAGLVGVDLLDTILHELIHARWPDLHEDAVAEFSETVSGFLDAEGFKQHDDEEE
jgi:hypothetical protein